MAAPLAINTNAGSLTAQRNLTSNARGMSQSISRLSSGLRIQSAADNAAGMAVAENMRAQQGGFKQAIKNANDGVAVLQTAESGYQSVSDILIRMRELAVQSANDSLSDTERGFLNTEFEDLTTEIDRIAAVIEYNGIKLMDGSGGDGSGEFVFQVGTRNTANDQVDIDLNTQNSTTLDVNSATVSSQARAQSAIDLIDSALEVLSTDRARIGSTSNELNHAVDNLSATVETYGNAVSQIRDADMAEESASFAKRNVLQQAGVSMLSQANQQPNLVMRLLG
jgi:flagellin